MIYVTGNESSSILALISISALDFIIVYYIVYKSQMLSEVLKKYEGFKKTNQKNLETLRQKLQQNFEQKTIQSLKIQNHKVSKIHSNQQQIENRLRRNAQLQGQMKLHLGGWVLLYDELNKALKQAGHLVNYAEYVHEQVKQIGCELKRRMMQQKQEGRNNKLGENEKEDMGNNQNEGEERIPAEYDISDMA